MVVTAAVAAGVPAKMDELAARLQTAERERDDALQARLPPPCALTQRRHWLLLAAQVACAEHTRESRCDVETAGGLHFFDF